MSEHDKWVIWYARDWGLERGIEGLGAIYAVENHGKMRGVRPEYNGDECAGPGQNNVRYATIREHGTNYTLVQYDRVKERLQTDLEYSLENSHAHIRQCFRRYWSWWKRWKYYNGINALTEAYPAKVEAWKYFLDERELEKRLEE